MEGYFEGNYRGGFLAVPKGGKYVGMADVRRADIGGRLHGTLSARTLLEVYIEVDIFQHFNICFRLNEQVVEAGW